MLLYELGLVFLFSFFLATLASFFNVVIFRTAREESFTKGRSKCEHCQKTILWQDNIPLLSFLLLGGRCRFCKKPIARAYFLSELLAFLSGFLFYFLYTQLPFWQTRELWELMLYFLSFFVLAFVVWSDLKYLLIPDFFLVILTLFALLLLFLGGPSIVQLWQSALALGFSLVFFGGLYVLAWKALGKEALGLGDLKLMVPLSLFLSWPLVVLHIFLSFIIGGMFAMMVLLTGRKKFGQVLPFAPFLIGAFIICIIFGEAIIRWYLGFLL